jgi:hypothetical protein
VVPFVSGDAFIAKKTDKQKKRRTKKVEDKMLGWGKFDRWVLVVILIIADSNLGYNLIFFLLIFSN